MNRILIYAAILMAIGAIIAGTAHAATIADARLILNHHPHVRAAVIGHPRMHRHLLHVIAEYPRVMTRCLDRASYDRWLISWIRSHHRLPGIDLLLGA